MPRFFKFDYTYGFIDQLYQVHCVFCVNEQKNSKSSHGNIFFFYLGFVSRTFTNHRTAGEGGGISLTPHYDFHPLNRHLDISRAITAESSPLT